MAGIDNLKPQNTRTKEEQREIARKGGIKSGEVRRKKKLMSEIWADQINRKYGTNGKNFNEAVDAIWEKGGSDLIRFWKEMREATEGNKVDVNTSGVQIVYIDNCKKDI